MSLARRRDQIKLSALVDLAGNGIVSLQVGEEIAPRRIEPARRTYEVRHVDDAGTLFIGVERRGRWRKSRGIGLQNRGRRSRRRIHGPGLREIGRVARIFLDDDEAVARDRQVVELREEWR